ncbi:MAG TPA: hypothetical protein VMY42_27060 [Thermoguttaceae bacterium]|nr:hypothetical protein [Thermoguttaceae bacterium]
MALRLPKFENTKCCFLTACGQVVTEDKDFLQWLAKQDPLEARYRAAGRSAYVRVYFGRGLGRHIHIDVAAREHFLGSPPTPKNKISEIRQAMKKVEGHEVNVKIVGLYRLSQTDLPEIVRSTLVETQVGEVSLKTTGVTLAVDGAPIHELRWWVPGDGGDARIQLKAEITRKIDDSYLEHCCELLESVFNVFVPRN